MPRKKRNQISEAKGSYHITSRTAGKSVWFDDDEKEYFVSLMEKLAKGFYIEILTFCVMSTHFHILVTETKSQAEAATPEELRQRYRAMMGKNAEPPVGSTDDNGFVTPDDDGGVERLRRRFGSISRFVQELKQGFSNYYNKKHNREGTLWDGRFKSPTVEKGDAQVSSSGYIELNPVRAKIVERPEDYRWNSLGMTVRTPARAEKLLSPIYKIYNNLPEKTPDTMKFAWYREFVYMSGGVRIPGRGYISPELIEEVKKYHGKLGIGDRFRYRVKNMTEGLAIGTFSFIADVQKEFGRKFIRPRSFLPGKQLFATRVLRL